MNLLLCLLPSPITGHCNLNKIPSKHTIFLYTDIPILLQAKIQTGHRLSLKTHSLFVLNQIRSDQLLSRVRLFVTPWIAAHQASLSITNSRSSLRLMSIESVMPSSHLILCSPFFLLPPIPPSLSLFQWVNSSHEVAKVLEFQL